MGDQAPVPTWLYGHLRRWHYLSFLKEANTIKLLDRVTRGALAPEAIERLVRAVDEDLGLVLHPAGEGAKVTLSRADEARVEILVDHAHQPLDRLGRERAARHAIQG